MSGTLFVVATPIGNLEDITARALRVLGEVALIAAEDTRRTGHLLTRYAIKTPSTSLHGHNEAKKTASLIARLQRGDSIALVSDRNVSCQIWRRIGTSRSGRSPQCSQRAR